jgi:branched-chain amino acid transport system substrate-binding protein
MLVSRRRWLRAATATVVVGLVAGCAVVTGDSGPRPVVVGVDLALTGPGAASDIVFHQALELRVAQRNAERERSGGRPLELRVRDNGSDRDASAANLAELAADPRVSAIITGRCGDCAISAAEQIDAAAVPVVSLAAPRAVAEPVTERRYLFRIGPEAASSADLMATELAAAGAAAIGLVTGGGRYGEDGARELGAAAAAYDIDLAVHEVAGGGADPARVAAAMTGWRPAGADPYAVEPAGLDAVVLWTPEAAAVDLAVALRAAGWDRPVWLDTAAAGELFQVGEAAVALSGARLLFPETLAMDDVVASLPDLARRRQWFDSYLSRYGTYHGPASFAADALDLIVAATDRIGTDPARVRDTLEAIRLPGLSGQVGFTPGDHSGLDARSLSVLRFTGDRWHATTT